MDNANIDLSTSLIRLLSQVKITSLSTLQEALAKLHKTHLIPHVIITSIRLSDSPSTMSVVGSTARADYSPRIFRIDMPAIDCFFSGTGDMFAALTVVRLREAVIEANLSGTKSWVSANDVKATDLPLAKAAEKVIGSMHAILVKTMEARDRELGAMGGPLGVMEKEKDSEKRSGLRRTKAAEVRVVQFLEDLRSPRTEWKAEALNGEEHCEGTSGPITTGPGARGNEGLGLQHLARLRADQDTSTVRDEL